MSSPTRRASRGRDSLRESARTALVSLILVASAGAPVALAANGVQPADRGRLAGREALRAASAPNQPAPPPAGSTPAETSPRELRAEIFPDEPSDPEAAAARRAAWRAERGAILFDAARFDPLADGEPEMSAFVPETPSFAEGSVQEARHWVVQWHEVPTQEERARVQAMGVELLSYVPNNAYLVRANALAMAEVGALDEVRWVGRYRPGYKVDRALGRLAAGRYLPRRLPGERQNAILVDLLVTPSAAPEDVAASIALLAPKVEIVGAATFGRGPGLVTVRLPLRALAIDLAHVANLEDVVAIEPRGEVRLHNDDAAWIGQSYNTFAQKNYAVSATIWNRGLMGEGEIIGLVDTGVDPDVCWMQDPLGLPPVSQVPPVGESSGPIPVDPSRRKIIGYNLLSSFEESATAYDATTADPHGTWAATSAVGDNPARLANESNPTAPHHDVADGMAPRAKLVVQDFANEAGELVGIGRPEWLILDGIFEQLYGAGARISTNSWGVAGNDYDLLAFFTDRMAWTRPDFLIVVSAGNEGPYGGTLESPATAKNALAVGATDARLNFGTGQDPENLWPFSSRGPTIDGRLKPDILMSGNKLITGTSDGGETGPTCTTAEATGTSFAAPLVAGFAALARQYYRTGYYPSGARNAADGFAPSAALVRATLVAGARSLLGSAGNDLGPCLLDTCDPAVQLCQQGFTFCEDDEDCRVCSGDAYLFCDDDRDCDLSLVSDDAPANDQGWGRLHLDDALYFAGDDRGLGAWDVPRASGLATGETWRTQMHVASSSEDLQVVLVWPDPPSLVASPSYLVNDLDLKLTAPDGTVYWGNGWGARDRQPFTRSYTQAGVRPQDDPNTVEMVRVPSIAAQTGTWTIEVVGRAVPGSPWIDGGERQDFAVVATGPVVTGSGEVRFTKPTFACEGEIGVEVVDSGATLPLSVTVETLSGDSETIALAAVSPGRFAASLPIVFGAPLASGDGTLEVVDGEEIRAVYEDAAPAAERTAFARAVCSGRLLIGSIGAAGGCDGDAFVDAAEEVDLEIQLANPTVTTYTDVSARLVTGDPRLFVSDESAAYGTILAGGAALPSSPFRVSLRQDVPPRTSIAAWLEVSSPAWTSPLRLPITLLTEADEVVLQGSWNESFTSGAGQCYDGDPAPTPGSWYWFDINDQCATTEATWQIGPCFGDRLALLPSCTGQVLSGGTALSHRLVSPKIETGAAGSTTILRAIRFRETYDLQINEDGQRCEWTKVDVFTNLDGRLTPTGYWRETSAAGNDEAVDLDPSTVSEWTLPPVADATSIQLIFEAGLRRPLFGDSCFSSAGDEVRWHVDDVEVVWDNVALEDDATLLCLPSCTAPPAPVAVTATRTADGSTLVGWDPVPGAHHYDVFRMDGGTQIFEARVLAPDAAVLLAPGDSGPAEYEVEAVDASGLCGSARSARATASSSTACLAAPGAIPALTVTDAASATCGATLTWDPAASGCGGLVRYRIHRSADPAFAAGPATLLAEADGLAFVDDALTTGWDAGGEPRGTLWTYEVRAYEPATGREGVGTRIAVRPGGPRTTGTWIDDAGDTGTVKLVSETLVDENGAGAGWSRSSSAIRRNGNWSYWSDADPLGDGGYEALSCTSLVSPEIELAATGAPQLRFFANYELEYTWDGMVVELSVDGGPFTPITPDGGYPGSFASTEPPPCLGAPGGTGSWINGCDYPPEQGCFTGPEFGGLTGWQEHTFDLGAWAGASVRFRINLSSDCGTNGGAVIDEVRVDDAALPTTCADGPCLPAPRFAGIASATDLDANASSGIEITWGDVEDWGGGGAGLFEIWRDDARIATLPSTERSFVDANAAPNVSHRYQVVARSGGGCDVPAQGAASVAATDCGPLTAATVDGARLTVTLSPARTSIVLRAEPIPGAVRYRFPYAVTPIGLPSSPTAIEAGAPEARHDAVDDGQTYFYSVEGGPGAECP